GDIARQVRWDDRTLDAEQWRLVMLDKLRRDTGRQMDLAPNMDGTGWVHVGDTSTASLSDADMERLLGIIRDFGERHRVEWSEPRDRRPVPPIEAYEQQGV